MGAPEIVWPPGPTRGQLDEGSVAIWCADLDGPAGLAHAVRSVLSPEELTSAQRIQSALHRERFVVTRGLLRLILAAYLEEAPWDLAFAAGARGKPELSGPPGIKPLHFSASRSGSLALFAVTAIAAVGVDLEQVCPLPDMNDIVARCFSDRENATFRALPEAHRVAAFYRAWTCKEAYLKATGEGIGDHLARVEVSLRPDEPPRLLAVDGNTERAAVWSLTTFVPADQWMGALAVRNPPCPLQCWSWPPSGARFQNP
jgi:4'-phosphopantetheinyl transferase